MIKNFYICHSCYAKNTVYDLGSYVAPVPGVFWLRKKFFFKKGGGLKTILEFHFVEFWMTKHKTMRECSL